MTDAQTLICLSPSIDDYLLSLPQFRVKRNIEVARGNVTYYISFILDGVIEEDKAELTIVTEPPVVIQWEEVKEYKGGDSITIYAEPVGRLGIKHKYC